MFEQNYNTLPYLEDFENAGALPGCWKQASNDHQDWVVQTGATPNANTGPNAAHSSSYYLYFDATVATTYQNAALISPPIDLTGAAIPRCTFRYHMYGADMGTMRMDVESPVGSDTWISVWTITGEQHSAATDAYTEAIVDLSAYAGSVIRTRFFGIDVEATLGDMAFDYVRYEDTPCPNPSALGMQSAAQTTANLSWTTGGATTWDIEYGAKDFTLGTGTAVANTLTNPHTLAGLTADTEYDYYVRDDCGGSTSEWIGPYSFRTLACAAQAFPYTEDFENAGALPTCWVQDANDKRDWTVRTGGTPTGGTGPSSAHANSYYVFLETSAPAGSGDQAILMTPPIDFSSASAAHASFYYHMFGPDMGTLAFEVESPAGSQNWVQHWTLSGQDQTSSGADWELVNVDISAYAGNIIRGRFIGTVGSYTLSDMAVDLVSFEACRAPTNLVAQNTAQTTADINWTSGGASQWDLEWGAVGFTQGTGTMVNDLVAKPYNLTGLTAGSSYDVYVRDDCGGGDGSSGWVGPFTFTTLQCALQSFPYQEDFENGGAMPACWLQSSSDEQDWIVRQNGTPSGNTGPDNAHTGTYYLYFEASDPVLNGDEAHIISPPIDFAGIANPSMSLYYHMFGFSMGELRVDIESPAGSGNWTTEYSRSGVDQAAHSDEYKKATIDLSAYSGSTARARISGSRGTGYASDVSFDLVTFESCFTPTVMGSSTFDQTSVSVDWTTGSATQWDIEYGEVGFTQGSGTDVADITSNPYNLTGLSAGTVYDYYVRDDCGVDGHSFWAGPYSINTMHDGLQGAGNSLVFDGVNEYVDMPGMQITPTDFTVEWWHYANTDANYNQAMGALNGWGAFHFHTTSTGEIYAGTDLTNRFSPVELPAGTFTLNEWQHFAFTYTGGNANIYRNGILLATKAMNAPTAWGGFRIGATGTNTINGEIDELRVWDIALSQASIQNWMCQKLNTGHGDYANLVAYYPFDQSGKAGAIDVTGNYPGELINMETGSDWITSGAPLGDVSVSAYTVNTSTTLNLATSAGDDMTMNVTAGSGGSMHLYRVDEEPSMNTPPGGADALSKSTYWGVKSFDGTGVVYEVIMDYDGHGGIQDEISLRLVKRGNNADNTWTLEAATLDVGANTLTLGGQTGTEFILGSTSGNSLAVEFFEISATVDMSDVDVRWVTASEINNDRFEIERSWNGFDFEYVGSIKGAGTSNKPNQYAFRDLDPKSNSGWAAKSSPVIYYRLKQVDFDGTTTYSEVLAVTMREKNGSTLSVLPNPVQSLLTVRLQGLDRSNANLTLLNAQGGIVFNQVEPVATNDHSVSLDVSRLAKGVYMLKVETATDVQTIRVVKD